MPRTTNFVRIVKFGSAEVTFTGKPNFFGDGEITVSRYDYAYVLHREWLPIAECSLLLPDSLSSTLEALQNAAGLIWNDYENSSRHNRIFSLTENDWVQIRKSLDGKSTYCTAYTDNEEALCITVQGTLGLKQAKDLVESLDLSSIDVPFCPSRIHQIKDLIAQSRQAAEEFFPTPVLEEEPATAPKELRVYRRTHTLSDFFMGVKVSNTYQFIGLFEIDDDEATLIRGEITLPDGSKQAVGEGNKQSVYAMQPGNSWGWERVL